MFTKQHYDRIAYLIGNSADLSDFVDRIIEEFTTDNKKFNKDKFIDTVIAIRMEYFKYSLKVMGEENFKEAVSIKQKYELNKVKKENE